MPENDNTGGAGGAGNPEGGSGEKSVSYETYKKTVAAEKSLREKLNAMEAEREAEKQARLTEQGKFKESAEEWQKKAMTADEEKKKLAQNFGMKIFSSEVKTTALQMGATPEAVDDILKVGDWSDVEIGEDFSVDKEKLKGALSKLQTAKPWFFTKSATAPKDVNPSNDKVVAAGGKSLSEMTAAELKEYALKNFK